ncbi:glycine cleavage system aminomethyltransferase GcvT [Oleidesulfovibrio sp.]|uniref:glycine cleavage system aminomethyltransferase GcvT n=1 Tax=Oleidesulfovibrio sp. TaxID=2909707 RepID=UPI003A85C6EE
MAELFQTPLTAWHHAAGAKMAPFAGWDMPIQYAGIIAEHQHTRSAASIFDICHMGEFLLKGAGAQQALSKVVTHNLATLATGKCRYGFLLNEQGGIQDDLIVYCLGEDEYMLVVNGACTDSDFSWIKQNLPAEIMLEDISKSTAKIDLQGPKSIEALESTLGKSFRSLGYFNFETVDIDGEKMIVSRTGYTGELGYEFYLPASKALLLWKKLLENEHVKPAGLGARDTLRLEVGLPLYGQDLDEKHTPSEAGYGMMLKSEADYIGKGADKEIREQLVALTIPGRRSARHHDPVTLPDGQEVGIVTSGSFAPSVGCAVALAYIKKEVAEQTSFLIKGARTSLEATRADLPFYKEGTARTKLQG